MPLKLNQIHIDLLTASTQPAMLVFTGRERKAALFLKLDGLVDMHANRERSGEHFIAITDAGRIELAKRLNSLDAWERAARIVVELHQK